MFIVIMFIVGLSNLTSRITVDYDMEILYNFKSSYLDLIRTDISYFFYFPHVLEVIRSFYYSY